MKNILKIFAIFGIISSAYSAKNITYNGDESRTVSFNNAWFNKFPDAEKTSGLKTKEVVEIPDGSMLNYASYGVIGNVIRYASKKLNVVPNPYHISHSGIALNFNPKILFDTVLNFKGNQLSEDEKQMALNELETCHHDIVSAVKFDDKILKTFVLEANGTPGQVLSGIMPHVQIHPLELSLAQYDGNVFVRPICPRISETVGLEFLNKHLGRSYESFSTFSELLKGAADTNKEESNENVFCSELAAVFYKDIGLLSNDINTSNVIPEELSYGSGEFDLLSNCAKPDIPLKFKYDFDHPSKGKCCVLF